MPALPSCILNPLWDQFAALLPPHHDPHPLGCHRPRIPDRIVFDKLIQVLVFGCGYRRIADTSCSATTLRRRRDELTATHGPGIPATSVAGQRGWAFRSLVRHTAGSTRLVRAREGRRGGNARRPP